MEIRREAKIETKVALTWGSVRVMPTGEHVSTLAWDVRWRHSCHGATALRESSAEPFVVNVSVCFPPG